jgi:hypothetical protein
LHSKYGFLVGLNGNQIGTSSSSEPVVLEDFLAYRNASTAVGIIDSTNVILKSGQIFDNSGGVMIHRTENIVIQNCTMAGYSEELMRLEDTQITQKLCDDSSTLHSGISVITFTQSRESTGLVLESSLQHFPTFKTFGNATNQSSRSILWLAGTHLTFLLVQLQFRSNRQSKSWIFAPHL